MTTCDSCQYKWSLSFANPATGVQSLYYVDTNPSFSYNFPQGGIWRIEAETINREPLCPGYGNNNRAYLLKSIVVQDPCPAGRLSVEVDQIYEASLPSSYNSFTPYWTAIPSGLCDGCVYTWSIYKTSETFFADPVPLGSNDLYQLNGKTVLRHSFSEPGNYKINVRMENPPGHACPYDYASMTAIHHVEVPYHTVSPSPSPTSDQPSPPPVISPVPLDVPATATQGSSTPTVTVTQPQVTYTAIPGITPQGTLQQSGQPTAQPTGTFAPVKSGTDKQASGAAPVMTKAAPADSVPAAPTTAAPMTATTRAPGFAIAGALCAGLVVLVLRRK